MPWPAEPVLAPTVLAVVGDLWVLYKPAGVLTHGCENPARTDLMTWAMGSGDAPAGLAPIHRLDSGTSGVLLASPDAALRATLGQAFADRLVTKVYRALVYGTTPPSGVVDKPLRDERRGEPVAAETAFRCIAWLPKTSYLEVTPRTGRKHQIRKHMQMQKHPILGDQRYALPARPRVPGTPKRLWLHALSVTLPDGRRFEAPLAPELAAHLAALGLPSGAANS